MRNDNRKSELFGLLAKGINTIDNGIACYNETSIYNKIARQQISCSQKVADTRLFVHLKHAIEKYCITSACILSIDTDIILLAIAFLKNWKF